METSSRWPLLLALALAGCSAEQMGTTSVLANSASWQLTMDPASSGLIDDRCAAGGDCTVHFNPHLCERMTVNVSPDGEVCGSCVGGSMGQQACGGFAAGLPYDCDVRFDSGAACVVCQDLRGRVAYRDCSNNGAPSSTPGVPSQTRAGCVDLHDKFTGAPCQICLNDGGNIVSNSCTPGVGGGDIGPVSPGNPGGGDIPDVPGTGTDPNNPGEDPNGPGDGSGDGDNNGDGPGLGDDGSGTGAPTTPDPCAPSFNVGSQAFVNEMNNIFGEARLSPPLAPSAAIDPNSFSVSTRSTNMCNTNHEWEELDEWSSHLPGRHDIDNLWTRNFGTSVRCYIMVNIAAERAYKGPCQRGDSCLEAFIGGAMAEHRQVLQQLQSRYDCVGSPIVLDLDGNGIRTERGEAMFDMTGAGAAMPSAWIQEGDALLARDIDGDGAITSVYELFGDVTADGLAPDGYAALRKLDDNDDGVIDAQDPAFGELLLWADNGDGVSDPAELVPVAETDIVRLNARSTLAFSQDEAGSELALWSSFERADGTDGTMCDVWFADGVDD